MAEAWRSFKKDGHWDVDVNVRNFIQTNYTPYDGDESFLEGPTEATDKLWGRLQELQKEEREHDGVLECETEVVSSLTAYGPGYIDESMKDLEQIVGLQTDKPLKRAFMPYGGIKMAQQAASTYGYEVNAKYDKIFNEYHKTHNQAVFDAYTDEMKVARHTHIVTGLPDTYGRGRIVGDYRRVALYGIDFLIQKKEEDKKNCGTGVMTEDIIRLREEIADQIKALKGMKEMAKIYGYDISGPATTAKEAIQWLYFGYLAAIKTQNGAAMSVGRISTFLDIYIERDLKEGTLTEKEAQELIDHMTMKFRMVKFARIPSYNQLFSGDPVWATLEVGGIGMDGRHMVWQYREGKLVDRQRAGLSYEGMDSPQNGTIIIVPQFKDRTVKIIIADDESQGDMLIPILEDVPEGEHYGYGRAATEIQEKTDIVYDEQQPLLALIYDNDEARTFDFSYIVNDQLDALEMDDYVYYFSFEFRTE